MVSSSQSLPPPVFILADEVLPDMRVFSIFKVIKVEETPANENSRNLKYTVTLGDKTGTLKLLLRESVKRDDSKYDDDYIKICTVGATVEVLNSIARFHKGFIRLEMDRWGVIRPCTRTTLI